MGDFASIDYALNIITSLEQHRTATGKGAPIPRFEK
jgi:hypothetical protein